MAVNYNSNNNNKIQIYKSTTKMLKYGVKSQKMLRYKIMSQKCRDTRFITHTKKSPDTSVRAVKPRNSTQFILFAPLGLLILILNKRPVKCLGHTKEKHKSSNCK